VKRQQASYGGAFDRELECDPATCTMMRCTIGPLEKNERVIFRVRSRLFTQTQIQVLKNALFAEKTHL
jgi:hypothetical protein